MKLYHIDVDYSALIEEGCTWYRASEADAALAQLRGERDSLQARIDALMLEYCPDEMTQEQLDEWAKRQVAVAKEDCERIKESLKE